MDVLVQCFKARKQIFLILSLNACKDGYYWMKSGLHFLQVLECMAEFMGYIVDLFRLHGFISDCFNKYFWQVYCFKLRNCTLSFDMATDEVTLTGYVRHGLLDIKNVIQKSFGIFS